MKHGVITGKLVARTALHVGSGAGSDTTDALLFRNAQGEWLIPGTSQGGVLRTIATRLAPTLGMKSCQALLPEKQRTTDSACGCPVCHLFGDLQPNEQQTEAEASKLWVYNAQRCEENVETTIRDGVGIDRSSGAAARAAAAKFDLEVIPAGTAFAFRIELEDANLDDQHLLVSVLAEWCAGRAWIGGNKARGLGAFTLEELRCSEYNLDTSDSLMRFLKDDSPWESTKTQARWFDDALTAAQARGSQTETQSGVAQNFVTVTLTLQAFGPMLTNDITTATWTGLDHAPTLRFIQKTGPAVLPGSGLRGVLRSHAERIARTLVTHRSETAEIFYQCCPACSPVETRDDAPLASCDALLKKEGVKSDVEVTDTQICLACQLFGSTRRGSRFFVEDGYQIGNSQYKLMDFLAIDRFTGGGLEGAKFDALVLWKPAFEVRLHLENAKEWELGWLMLVLRDLADAHLAIGFGASKGFGKVSISDWQVEIGFIAPEDFPGGSNLIKELKTRRSGLYHVLESASQSEDTDERKKAHDLASSWLQSFINELDSYQRGEQIHLTADSYFDKVASLYDKEVNLDA